MDLVIRNGQVVTAAGRWQGAIGIAGGRIAALGTVGPGAREIDAGGRIVMPGGVDPHCHVEQMSGMGLMNADTFETATRSAAMGGTTSVISFAAQARGERLRDTVAAYAARAARGAAIDHAFHVTVTDPSVEGLEADLADLAAAGHRSVKLFTTYDIRLDDAALIRVLAAAKAAGMLTCVHAENHGMLDWTKARLLAAGLDRPEHHALSHPRLAEVEAVERVCRFAEFLDAPVMIFHVSTARALAAVRDARARGVPVRAETCPHYLLSTAEVLRRDGIEGAKWMCSPPQRDTADVAALWQGLARGDLDLVSSDHAPYRFDETGKLHAGATPPFPAIANGMPGLETRLPLLFDAMVSRGHGGAEAFVRATATAPARIYGLPGKGDIAPGMDADLVIWDPGRRVTYGADDLHDAVGYNPWAGTTVTGWPEVVILRGAVVKDGDDWRGTPGAGRFLPRAGHGVSPAGRMAPELAFMEGDR
ncbi:MAG: dihydropyrimidinase [Rhodobacteraceae bacterium]|nr:dihydropyrimidinase [Paracoccaceae bacterium]